MYIKYIILLLFFIQSCKSRKITTEEFSLDNIPIKICANCGNFPITSPEIKLVQDKYKSKDTLGLMTDFESKNELSRFLSAIYLDKLIEQKIFKSNSAYRDEIQKYKQSSLQILISEGCTNHQITNVSSYFYGKDEVSKYIENYLDSKL